MYLCVILSIMTFKFWLIVIKKRVLSFYRKIQNFLFEKLKIKHDRYQNQYCNLSTTFNFSFVSILHHNLQKPYLPKRISFTRCQTRTLNTSGLFKVKECCFLGGCFTNLRTITRFEEVIFLERREDAYTIRSVDVSAWMYFVLA